VTSSQDRSFARSRRQLWRPSVVAIDVLFQPRRGPSWRGPSAGGTRRGVPSSDRGGHTECDLAAPLAATRPERLRYALPGAPSPPRVDPAREAGIADIRTADRAVGPASGRGAVPRRGERLAGIVAAGAVWPPPPALGKRAGPELLSREAVIPAPDGPIRPLSARRRMTKTPTPRKDWRPR
jgi:hypothetical protein